MKMSQPGKGNSFYDHMKLISPGNPRLADPVGKCLRHFRTLNRKPRRHINLCLQDSSTYQAILAGRNLEGEFQKPRAEACYLHWIQYFASKEWKWIKVEVDPASRVVRTQDGFYCLLEDVQCCLCERDNQGIFHSKTSFAAHPTGESVDAYNDILSAKASLETVTETERRVLIDARLGQGKFREELWTAWGQCAVTGCRNKQLLRASHIKPWRLSDNRERLDRFNGFLFTPNLDHLFDSGLVSFSDNGKILFSSRLAIADASLLGVNTSTRLCTVYPANKPYLAEHRRLFGYT
jgi:hypothetical protein